MYPGVRSVTIHTPERTYDSYKIIDVIYLHMFIKAHLIRTPGGQKNMPKAVKFETIGKVWRGNTASMTFFALARK